MEADLARFYNVDIRDRWRRDADGRRLLTLRQIAVRIRFLPADSAIARVEADGLPDWQLEHVLLADVWQAVSQSKKPHPLLAAAQTKARQGPMTAKKRRTVAAASARRAERQRAIEAGEIT